MHSRSLSGFGVILQILAVHSFQHAFLQSEAEPEGYGETTPAKATITQIIKTENLAAIFRPQEIIDAATKLMNCSDFFFQFVSSFVV